MLQLNFIRNNRDLVIERLKVRGIDAAATVDSIIDLDENLRSVKKESEDLAAQSNSAAKKIGELMREGKREEAEEYKAKSMGFKEQIKTLTDKLAQMESELQEQLYLLPNLPHISVPAGTSEEDNEVVLEKGEKPKLGDEPLPHWELAEKYKIIDLELGVKVTGSGFPIYRGKGAKLQRALIQFFLDQAVEQGYEEVQVPILVNEASAFSTGQLPDKEGQMYYVGQDDFYLIPTSEVPITNMYRNDIVEKEKFPIKHCGYTPCFRREAGSYGSHVRGLNRLHQFDKVELVQIVHPDTSYDTLDDMSSYVQSLLVKLELPYRVLRLCGGDLGFTSALTYDMEVYSAAQERWLEVSSVSNFETFQSNRLKTRFRNEEGKTTLVHTLNGSALALPRIMAALLENNQSEKGIKIPDVLIPYTGFEYLN